ncbi:putative BOI-related E3 ubiquitin-protein ligase 3 [Canna indica]|uniref:BOI-related E3 ubiquitin-protein ligase 3 n=1 Tax=Canna indica TaxID=4628 RepID=A0AAQ3QQ82_9LILI|nr:putative BOI-related E3 ubiquitin-protein ligase 3 [Canna indica]
MEVQAHQLHRFPSSQFLSNRELVINTEENQQLQSLYNDMQMALFMAPISGATAGVDFFQHCSNSQPPVTAPSDSSLTTFATAAAAASRKRPRPVSFIARDDMSSFHLQNQMLDLDVDRLILQHVGVSRNGMQTEKVQAELAERRRRFTRQIIAALEERVSKRLKAKEEEIARIGKLNWALEERIKSLCVENQIWRDLAQSNEAAANVLRTNLEQVLAAQVRAEEKAAADADVAESCCCGENGGREEEEEVAAGICVVKKDWMRACWSCGEREPSVLLLPCRHLCLCSACGPAAAACPVCNCTKSGNVHVNMS